MFQLWKLVLLCGLLAGTSASLLDSLGKDVLRKPKSGLEKGLVNLDSTLKTVFQNLKTELESRCSEEVVGNQKTGSSQNLLEQLISRIFQAVNRFTGETHAGNVKTPPPLFTVNLIPCRPLLGESLDLDLKVDLQTSVSIETDPETGDSKVVVGICPNNPGSISLTVQHSRLGLLSDVVDNGVNFARQLVSSAVQHELCPRIRELLESLDAECVKKLIGKSQPGEGS
uniref:Lipid-binding serum glycoprotein N-terminal domain-containing protein n=1 Tax=Moschus moschiferus TaxID=68415 RepID=A0A8C6DP65_MOSMO